MFDLEQISWIKAIDWSKTENAVAYPISKTG